MVAGDPCPPNVSQYTMTELNVKISLSLKKEEKKAKWKVKQKDNDNYTTMNAMKAKE